MTFQLTTASVGSPRFRKQVGGVLVLFFLLLCGIAEAQDEGPEPPFASVDVQLGAANNGQTDPEGGPNNGQFGDSESCARADTATDDEILHEQCRMHFWTNRVQAFATGEYSGNTLRALAESRPLVHDWQATTVTDTSIFDFVSVNAPSHPADEVILVEIEFELRPNEFSSNGDAGFAELDLRFSTVEDTNGDGQFDGADLSTSSPLPAIFPFFDGLTGSSLSTVSQPDSGLSNLPEVIHGNTLIPVFPGERMLWYLSFRTAAVAFEFGDRGRSDWELEIVNVGIFNDGEEVITDAELISEAGLPYPVNVPEPSAALMLCSGTLALGCFGGRRRKN